MSRRAIKLAALALLVAWLSVLIYAAVASRADTSRPNVLSLKVNGVVDPFMTSYIQRGIETASHERDAAVLLTIDTPGGLDTSMRDIVRAILSSNVPVICWTGPSGARAASAGTVIMLACPVNAKAPGTENGGSQPVGVSGVIES